MVTTTVRMLDWVHGNTSNSWPAVSLSLCLVPASVGLEEWLVGSLTTSDEANHGSATTNDGLSGAGWKSDSGLLSIVGVTDDDARGAGGSGERSSISELGLAVGHNCSFWQVINWDNISNCELSLRSTVDVLAGVHSFDGDEILNSLLVSVCISEDNLCKWRSSAWVVDNVLHNSLHVSLSLNVVKSSESSWCNSVSAA